MEKSTNQSLGKILRSFRLYVGKTQEQIALEAGLDRTYISMLERGEASPTFVTLEVLAKTLNVKVSEIVMKYEEEL